MPGKRPRVLLFFASDAEDLGNALMVELESSVEVVRWWREPGQAIGDSIIDELKACDYSIGLLTPGGVTTEAAAIPNDNVIFELGLSAGILGPSRTLMVEPREGIRTPIHLAGLSRAAFPTLGTPKEKAQAAAHQITGAITRCGVRIDPLPKAFSTLSQIIRDLRNAIPEAGDDNIRAENLRRFGEIDVAASDFLAEITRSLSPGGIDPWFVNEIRTSLEGADTMFGVDSIGPGQWLRPEAYTYLSLQIREYARKNVTAQGWTVTVDSTLKRWIDTACKNATHKGLPESVTEFDNPERVTKVVGAPTLQIARILLWDREELTSLMGSAVIRIHENFHVPLFFLQTKKDDPRRRFEFVMFRTAQTSADCQQQDFGFSSIAPSYKPEALRGHLGTISGIGELARTVFERYMSDPGLLLAADAVEIFKKEREAASRR